MIVNTRLNRPTL